VQRKVDDRAEDGRLLVADRATGKSLHDHVLGLQRDYGNGAVTGVVQRKKDRPASTDAPGAKPRKPSPKAPAIENLAPTAPNPKFSSWATSDLADRARSEMSSDVKNSLYFAAELLEEYWFRRPGDSRAIAMNIWRVYKKLGDDKSTKFWELVYTGQFDPRKPVEEDMSDKEF
jgi:hypothetical protein